jgi:hypothetical protein
MQSHQQGELQLARWQLWGQLYCLELAMLHLLLLLAALQQLQLPVLSVMAVLRQGVTLLLRHMLLLLLLALLHLLQLPVLCSATQASLQQVQTLLLLRHMLLPWVQPHSLLQWYEVGARCLQRQTVSLLLLLLLLLLLPLRLAVLLLLALLPPLLPLQQQPLPDALLPSWPAQICLGQQMQSAHVLLLLVWSASLLLALLLGAACQPECCLLLAQLWHWDGCLDCLVVLQQQGVTIEVSAASTAAAAQGRQQ